MGDWLARNLPCSDCGSSDAMQESEHHYKCFSCGITKLKRNANLGHKGVRQVPITANMIPPGGFYSLDKRKLSKDTAQKYKISCTLYNGTFGHGDKLVHVQDHWVYVFNKYSNGNCVSQKIRSCTDKNLMKILGDSHNKELFGQQVSPPNPQRFVVITEGEFDAATVFQETGFASVSINNGAESAVSNIRNNIDWLSKWAYVVLALDNDKAGLDATQKVIDANLFEPGKLRLAYWPLKDANDMLLADRGNEIKKVIWDAEEYRPKDILLPSDCLDEALTKPQCGADTPWAGLTDTLKGWGKNTIVTIAAADGIGKTEIVDEIINKLVTQNKKVWLYSCEQEPGETLLRQAGKQLDLPLHIPGAKWDEEKIKPAILKLEEKLYLWRPEKSVSTEEFFAKMRYSVLAYGTQYFILDHLKGIESQLVDPIRGMGKFMCDLKGFVKVHNVCAILLSHVAKDKKQGKAGQDDESWNRGRVPTKESVYGSSAINAWSNVIIGLSRNVEADDPYEACITRLTVLKNRLMGNRGAKAVYLQYIEDTGRLLELPQADYEAYMEDEKE